MADTTTWTNYWGSDKADYWNTKTNSFNLEEESYSKDEDKRIWAWDSDEYREINAVKSGASGLASGAAAGSVAGPIGTIIGGVVGWIVGIFSSLFGGSDEEEQEEYDSYLDQITTEKENLTIDYNRKIQDLQFSREQQLRDLKTTNTRLQQQTDRTVESRESQLQLNAKQIEAQSLQNAETLKNANTELIKETSSQIAKLGSSGFRNTGTATKRIEETQQEGEEAIRNQKYQMDVSLYSSNYQMGKNYLDSTYTAYSYQDTIADNIVSYGDWLEQLATETTRLKEDYDRAMAEYDKALLELRESKDFDTTADTISSILSGLTSFGSSLASTIASGKNILSSSSSTKDYYDIIVE